MIEKFINKVKRKLGIPIIYASETSKVRNLVLPYCEGYGCDIGFGGDKIKPDAKGIDFATPYAVTGKDKVDIPCDVIKDSIPVADGTFDYVYSSHLIEDFEDTEEGLRKFIRILKDQGNLVLVFPDQKVYEENCKKTGQPLNAYHKHAEMGLRFMKERLNNLPEISYTPVYESNCEVDYNVILVAKITKNGIN